MLIWAATLLKKIPAAISDPVYYYSVTIVVRDANTKDLKTSVRINTNGYGTLTTNSNGEATFLFKLKEDSGSQVEMFVGVNIENYRAWSGDVICREGKDYQRFYIDLIPI